MIFEDELDKVIRAEIERLKDQMIAGHLDIRIYDRTVGGIHALRLVSDEFFPDIRKKLNER
jgi:hypothetical protein